MPRFEQQIGKELAELKSQVKKLQKGRLRNSSLEGGSIPVFDNDEVLKTIIGRQPDGSYGVLPRNSGPQPTPTAPTVQVGDLGAVEVSWDGGTVDADLSQVHGHTEVIIAHSEAGEIPDLEAEGHRAGTIRDREGGEVTVLCSPPGTWYFGLRVVGADRVSKGRVSEATVAEIETLVDAEEIKEQLEEAARERQEYIDQFNERTAEYEAAQQEREDAIAAADAWSAQAFYRADQSAAEAAAAKVEASAAASQAQDAQTKYDQVSSRQDASEEEIEAARQAAAAAHAAAGDAMEYAATTRDSVEGLRPIQSTSAPSGQGDGDGQVWERYDTLGSDRKLIGSWRWQDGVWNAVSLDVTYLPMADISQATIGDARAQRIFAEVGEVQRLLVGDATNLLPDSALQILRSSGTSTDMWAGSFSGWSTTLNQSYMPIVLRWNGGADERLTYRTGAGLGGIQVKAGDQFHLSWYGWKIGAESQSFIRPRYMDASGNFAGWGPTKYFVNGWANDSLSWAVPEDTAIRSMEICFEGRGGNSQRGHWGDFSFTRVQAGELTVDGLLRSTEAVIHRLFTDETVARVVFAEVVRAGLLEADEALIGDVLLKDGAVTAPKLHVTEEMVAEFAQILHLVADQVDMNSFVAQSGMVGVLEAVGLVLRDQAAGRRTEVSGSGLSIVDTATDEPILQLGLYGDDFFSLTNGAGEQSVVINRNGLIAGEVVSADEDFMQGGRPLLGRFREFPGMQGTDAALDAMPRGIVAQLPREFTESTTSGAEVTIGYLQARLFRGRLYRLKCEPFSMHSDTAGAEILVYQTTSEDGWPPMPHSGNAWNRGPQGGWRNSSGEPLLEYSTLMRPETDQYFRCIFVVRRTSGSSMRFLNWSRGTAHLMIEDMGADMNQTGRPLFRLSGNSGDVGTAESLVVTTRPAEGRNYQSSNYQSSSFSQATPESTRYRHGFWDLPGSTTMHYMAALRFGSSAAAVGDREVISAEWRVFIDAWALKTVGDQVRPGVRISAGTLPSSLAPSSVDWLEPIDGILPGRWTSIPVPNQYLQEAIDGTAQLVLGQPSLTRRGGAATPINDGVRLALRVTQT